MARKRKLAAAVFCLGSLHASSLMALGLGELELESFLNEPLKASVDLLNMEGMHQDQIRIRLANSEDFARLGVERVYFLTTIQFDVVADEAGRPRIMISTDKPVLEPYLDFIVEARWPTGRLLREYTVLVDPPVYTESAHVVSASQRVYEEEGIPAAESAEQPSAQDEGSVGLFPDASQGGAGSSGVQKGAGSSRVKTTGTRVDVRDSNLAPGAMPQRNFNTGTAASPAPGARYMISRDDTLWHIADNAKPSGASVHQVMLDIQRLNPDAFINGNINRIKAGYIIYLPTADDISSADLPAALAEVQEQNAAWREGRDAELYARKGPTLRISAGEPDAEAPPAEPAGIDAIASDTGESSTIDAVDGGMPGTPGAETVDPAAAVADGRLAEAEQELETLKRIVSLKDDQIAALQNALAEAGVESEVGVESETGIEELYDGVEGIGEEVDETGEAVEEELPGDSDALVEFGLGDEEFPTAQGEPGDEPAALEDEWGQDTAEPAPVEPVVEEPEPELVAEEPAVEPAAETQPDDTEGGGLMSNLMYIIGAAILAALAFVFVRRRKEEDEEFDVVAQPVSEAPSNTQLREQTIEAATPVDEPVAEEKPEEAASPDNRGYGQRKHDEYADDIDASDALAEADIYIAYGRHPQAIDLLNNALEVEPSNPVYRLKLLEIYTELGDRGAASAELEKIHATGDASAIDRADSIVRDAAAEAQQAAADSQASSASLEVDSGAGETLGSDFSGLEIENEAAGDTIEDDLDLSGDFASSDEIADDEELVIADDDDGMSTKLDLARAYLDMGDDDGARQILDEIVAEGNEDLKSEARTLLDRIGG